MYNCEQDYKHQFFENLQLRPIINLKDNAEAEKLIDPQFTDSTAISSTGFLLG